MASEKSNPQVSPNTEVSIKDQPETNRVEKKCHGHSGLQLLLICLGLSLAAFLVALDNTIIATAIPKITDEFGALDAVGWYASAYLLTTCAFQLMFGTLYKVFSVKLVFLVAIGIFEIGSAVCGAAPNSTALIVGRAIAGLGSAGVFSGSLVIISLSVSLEKRPTYNGILLSMFGVASVVGPLLGGAFTDHVTWRWCFYINLPIGAVTVIAIVFFFKLDDSPSEVRQTWRGLLSQLDPIGTCMFIPGIVCLLLALQWGGSKYNWSDGRIISLLIIFGVLMLTFCIVQVWQGEAATTPPRVFRNRSMIFGPMFAFLVGGSYFIMVYFIPIWFQAIKGVSAMNSGIMCIPMILAVVVFSLLTGVAITLSGHYVPLFFVSAVFSAVGAGLLTTLHVHSGAKEWIGYQVVYGIGIGTGFQLAVVVCQVVLDEVDLPLGMALMVFFQSFGGAIFTSVGESIFLNGLESKIQEIAPAFDASMLLRTGVTDLTQNVPPSLLSEVQENYDSVLAHVWYVSVALSALSIVAAFGIEWRRIQPGSGLGAMHG